MGLVVTQRPTRGKTFRAAMLGELAFDDVLLGVDVREHVLGME